MVLDQDGTVEVVERDWNMDIFEGRTNLLMDQM